MHVNDDRWSMIDDCSRNSISAPAYVLTFNVYEHECQYCAYFTGSVAFRYVEITSRFETKSFSWSRASGFSSSSSSQSRTTSEVEGSYSLSTSSSSSLSSSPSRLSISPESTPPPPSSSFSLKVEYDLPVGSFRSQRPAGYVCSAYQSSHGDIQKYTGTAWRDS